MSDLPKFSPSAPLLSHARLALLLSSLKPRCLAVAGTGEEGPSHPTPQPSQAPLGILGQAQSLRTSPAASGPAAVFSLWV